MIHKLTEQELQTINELETTYAQLTTEFGRLSIEKKIIEKQLAKVSELEAAAEIRLTNLQTEESSFAKTINEKYGVGTINLETGEYITVNS